MRRQAHGGMSWVHGWCGRLKVRRYCFFHLGVAAQSAKKGPAEMEHKSVGVVINKQTHHWCRCSETAVLITVTHDGGSSTTGKRLLQEMILSLWGRRATCLCERTNPQPMSDDVG